MTSPRGADRELPLTVAIGAGAPDAAIWLAANSTIVPALVFDTQGLPLASMARLDGALTELLLALSVTAGVGVPLATS